MKIISNKDDAEFINFLTHDIFANTYILGNYHKYSINSQDVKFFVSDPNIRYVLMQYYNDFVFYTTDVLKYTDTIDIIKQINKTRFRVLSGNQFSVEQLSAYLPHKKRRITQFMSYGGDKKNINYGEVYRINKLEGKDINKALFFLNGIEEFRGKFDGNEGYKRLNKAIVDDAMYGYYLDNQIIATVGITANSGISCMLTDICVSPQHRNQGISKQIISYVINVLIESGITYINLYVDNEIALKMYQKLGFVHKSVYLSLYGK